MPPQNDAAHQHALKAEEAQVASTEQRAGQLWDEGQPDAAEALLRDASNVVSLSSSSKVGVIQECFSVKPAVIVLVYCSSAPFLLANVQ